MTLQFFHAEYRGILHIFLTTFHPRKISFFSSFCKGDFRSDKFTSDIGGSSVCSEGREGENFGKMLVILHHSSPMFSENLGDRGQPGVKHDGQYWSCRKVRRFLDSFYCFMSWDVFSFFYCSHNKGRLVVPGY